MNFHYVTLGLAVFLLQTLGVFAQVGTTICACQPASYQFTLDFQLSCNDFNVTGPGVNTTRCLERGPEETSNLIPVVVNTFQIIELNQDLEPVAQTSLRGNFLNGANISYTSIITQFNASVAESAVPRGISLVITGRNAENVSVVSSSIVVFNNDCTVYPVLEEGETLGWTLLVSSILFPATPLGGADI